MLDAVNEELVSKGDEPIAFDHDCREGICGACGFVIDGEAHGRLRSTTVCQLHMRNFKDGESLTIEPFPRSCISRHQRFDGEPLRLRSHHLCGWIYFG